MASQVPSVAAAANSEFCGFCNFRLLCRRVMLVFSTACFSAVPGVFDEVAHDACHHGHTAGINAVRRDLPQRLSCLQFHASKRCVFCFLCSVGDHQSSLASQKIRPLFPSPSAIISSLSMLRFIASVRRARTAVCCSVRRHTISVLVSTRFASVANHPWRFRLESVRVNGGVCSASRGGLIQRLVSWCHQSQCGERFHVLSASRAPFCFVATLVSIAPAVSTCVKVEGLLKTEH